MTSLASTNREGNAPGGKLWPRLGASRARASSSLIDIVVFLGTAVSNREALAWAAATAEEHEARLIGVFIPATLAASRPEMFARGGALREVIAAGEERLARAEAEERDRFEAVARRRSLRWEWRRAEGHSVAELVSHARYGDLAVVVRTDASDRSGAPPDLTQRLVLTSGRPVVVLPGSAAAMAPRRIVVGWNAGPEATRAVAGAMPLLTRAAAVEVLVVHQGEDGVSSHGQEPGADLARHLARHGASVGVRRLWAAHADVGAVLLHRAAAFGADLVVMGAFSRTPLSEWLFGGVTRTALADATLPVLMCR
ncbi:MAG TPA: universal stress protein [Vicinamibacteria bacterium]|nr:universal stress protein [Vicinamibacteria bacterium]